MLGLLVPSLREGLVANAQTGWDAAWKVAVAARDVSAEVAAAVL